MLKKWLISLVVVLAFALSACTPTSPNTDSNQNNTNQNRNTNINITSATYEDIKVVPREVFNTFTEKYPNTKVKKLELDSENGSYIYEIEGYDATKNYELKINPMDGNILREKQDTKNSNDNKDEITIEDVNKIQDLIDETLKDAGNDYTIDEWNLKSNNGQIIFEIEVVNDNYHDIEYKYNVNSGELIEKDQ